MTLDPVVHEWAALALRWLHIVTAIAWIGSSFYFIALDLGLRKRDGLPDGVHGEEWQVHGGGFYHIQKYLVAPEAMPEHLTWFKWESYATWLSGFALMAIVYYAGADLFLVDPNVLDMPVWAAVLVSAGSLGIGWIAYDLICRTRFGDDNTRLMLLLYVILVAMAWGYTQVFPGRASLLHLGAFTATIMTANVFFVIIPNQKIVVADLKAGREPDAKYGRIAKQRSTHNNYLTLPVLFLMISNHYPLVFASRYNWAIAALVFLIGVAIRHWFNSVHGRRGRPVWAWAVAAALFVAIVALSAIPRAAPEVPREAALAGFERRLAASARFPEVENTVLARCSMCHAAEPLWEGIAHAPRGVQLESVAEIVARARDIYLQAGLTNAMPPANVSFMEPAERQLIAAWYEEAADEGER